eukprot:m.221206 g.221206  ORF g.221206 m.221206 type:complete len:89 (+) comp39955_c0_seq28:960-1226(+)
MTPLLYACSTKKDPYMKATFLADQGANLKAFDLNGWTALHFVAKNTTFSEKEIEELITLAVKGGLSVNQLAADGCVVIIIKHIRRDLP